MPSFLQDTYVLTTIFAFLMGFAMLVYAILDGYDLGVGGLTLIASDKEKDEMIQSIGPFWDANETWLVLGVGILLIAFPKAHGIILTNLYIPVLIMLIGLILRGVSFEFRIKVPEHKKSTWNNLFAIGSLLTAFAQGFMLGEYIVGFEYSIHSIAFSVIVGFSLIGGYTLIGSTWLIMKTCGEMQKKAILWAKKTLFIGIIGITMISLATPYVSERIFNKWFTVPNFFLLSPIPIITAYCAYKLFNTLQQLPLPDDQDCWKPFMYTVFLYILSFIGLAYSFYPYIVPQKLLIHEAASSPESLLVILMGVGIVLPFLILYTIMSYRVFYGKVKDIHY